MYDQEDDRTYDYSGSDEDYYQDEVQDIFDFLAICV